MKVVLPGGLVRAESDVALVHLVPEPLCCLALDEIGHDLADGFVLLLGPGAKCGVGAFVDTDVGCGHFFLLVLQ